MKYVVMCVRCVNCVRCVKCVRCVRFAILFNYLPDNIDF